MTARAGLPAIASFWYGSDLSWMEVICIRSYLDHGHRFILYSPHDIPGLPDGAELRHASEIFWPPPFDVSDYDRLRVAVASDLFRLHLIRETGAVWVDLDAYCVRPFDFGSDYIIAPSLRGQVLSGVIGLPRGSAALAQMLEFVSAPNPVQPWRGARLKRIAERRMESGESWGIEALPWGCSGPKALDHFLKQTGEDRFALPSEALYALPPERLWMLHSPVIATEEIERDGVHSVHFYGHQKAILAERRLGLPQEGSYLARLCQRHGVDPKAQPIQLVGWMRRGGG